MVVVGFQTGIDKARDMFKVRGASQNPKSTMGWSPEQEDGWKRVLEWSREGLVTWISSSNDATEAG